MTNTAVTKLTLLPLYCVIFFFLFKSVRAQQCEAEPFRRNLQTSCDQQNVFPMFYGGVYHNFARYTDVTDDGESIVTCGESYSYNFVNQTMQAFVLLLDGNSGMYKWGKFYQDNTASPIQYISLLHVCKFNPDKTKIVLSGQVNSYKPFVGFVDAKDGVLKNAFVLSNSGPNYGMNGYSTRIIELDRSGNIIGGVYYMNGPLQLYKIDVSSGQMTYQMQIGDVSSMGNAYPRSCLPDNTDVQMYIGSAQAVYETETFGTGTDAYTQQIQYYNSTVLQVSTSNFEVNWQKKNQILDRIGSMQCLPQNTGIVGCASYAATTYLFSLDKQGDHKWNYMFSGDNPESCYGVYLEDSKLFVLLDTMSSSYTYTGYNDAVIMQFEVSTGKLKAGKFFSLGAQLTLGNGLGKIANGALVFGGAAKKVNGFNMLYNSLFIEKVDFSTSKYSCQNLVNIPDITAFTYKVEQGAFVDTTGNGEIKTKYVKMTVYDQLKTYNLKTIYKAYQMCFSSNFNSIYERANISAKTLEIVDSPTSQYYKPYDNQGNLKNSTTLFTLPYSSELRYYLYEVGQQLPISDPIWKNMVKDVVKVTMSDNTPIPSFMSLSGDKIKIETFDKGKIGNYTLLFRGCDSTKVALLQLTVQVADNTAPYINFTQNQFKMLTNETLQLQIPDVQDKENNSEMIMEFSYNGGEDMPYFMTYDSNIRVINVQPLSELDKGEFTFVAKVYEKDAPTMTNTYQMHLEVKPAFERNLSASATGLFGKDGTPFPDKGQLIGYLGDVTDEALIPITFSEDIAVPRYSNAILKTKKWINVTLTGPQEPYNYDWEVESIDEKGIKIQMLIQRPEAIGLMNEKENVKIQFDPYLFKARADPSNYLFNTIYNAKLNMVIDMDDPNTQMLSAATTTVMTILGVVMGSSFILQGLFSNVMSSIWAVLNSLQILTFFGLLKINMPSHLYMFYQMLMMSHFDVLPFKDIIEDGITSRIMTDPFSTNFDLYGYSTTLIGINYGDIFLTLIIFVSSFLIYKTLQILVNRIRLFRHRFPKIKQYFADQLVEYKYNGWIRLSMETYLDVTLFSMVNIISMKYQSGIDTVCIIFSIIIMIYAIAVPIVLIWYLNTYKTQLDNEEMIEKFGTLWADFRFGKNNPRFFHVYFCLRRIYYAIILCLPQSAQTAQVSLNIVHCIMQFAYIAYVRPYERNKLNYMEVFNEIVIATVACQLYVFTDIVVSIDVKNRTGWAIILIILSNIFVNLLLVIVEMVQIVIRKCKEWRARKTSMKYAVPPQKSVTGDQLTSTMNLFSKGGGDMTTMNDVTATKLNQDDLQVEEFTVEKPKAKKKKVMKKPNGNLRMKSKKYMTTRHQKTGIEELKEDDMQQYNTTKQKVPIQHKKGEEDPFHDLQKISEESKHNSGSGSTPPSGSQEVDSDEMRFSQEYQDKETGSGTAYGKQQSKLFGTSPEEMKTGSFKHKVVDNALIGSKRNSKQSSKQGSKLASRMDSYYSRHQMTNEDSFSRSHTNSRKSHISAMNEDELDDSRQQPQNHMNPLFQNPDEVFEATEEQMQLHKQQK